MAVVATSGPRALLRRWHRRRPEPSMLDLIQGHRIAAAIHVAARLGIADVLAAGPRTPGEIALRVDADPDGVRRLLRALAAVEIFAVRPDGRYELTPQADTLRADHPESLRPAALFWGGPPQWENWGTLLDVVREGAPVVPAPQGGDEPVGPPEPVVAAYDFTGTGTVVEVGGRGELLAAVLRAAPHARGTLHDPAEGPLPADADCYLLKNVLHDHPEAPALRILRGVREAIAPHGRLLVVEAVLPEGNTPHPAKMTDLEKLLTVGGRERTERDHRALLAQAGFELARIIPTASPLSILEALPA
ncbi:acetylserotonin O-methyltransferase [Pseudonocardia sp. WMMC193]|uniref:acetylserotonin O-methyltransferase n=1 Tax=Pseudonocardia sp. WMMC193 TaxID=2911965 RepID=UPI001F36E107|nr:acetylserotonin O-methyltransferase [Pseudonocardia sp. WMMC193]MCF7551023.1 acetylserotonin O-methyltransferase [Pseudonocardia sp. WMMC193]